MGGTSLDVVFMLHCGKGARGARGARTGRSSALHLNTRKTRALTNKREQRIVHRRDVANDFLRRCKALVVRTEDALESERLTMEKLLSWRKGNQRAV